MVREYVGARYVPKFMGTFDATQQYEALCVVDNGLGTSYISKIPTPAGTPLTDTDHWAIYGASSGAIINLQNQIDNIENTEIPGINATVQSLSDDIEELPDAIFTGKILLVMDSYGGTYGNDSGDTYTIPDALNSMFDNRVEAIVVPGGGFYRVDPNGLFINALNTFIASKTADQLKEFKHVIVASGRNENATDEATELLYINDFYTTARASFVNAKMYIGYIAGGDNNSAHGTRIQQYTGFISMKKASEQYNIQWLNGVDAPMHDYANLYSDGVHPTSTGKREIAYALYQALVSGSYKMIKSARALTFTAKSGFTITQGGNQAAGVDGDVIYYPAIYMNVTLPAAIDSSNYSADVADITPDGYMAHPYSYILLPYDIYYAKNGFYERLIGEARLTRDGTLQLNVSANSTQRADNITTLTLFGGSQICIPINET